MNEGQRKKNVLILAEGYEEKPYIDKILSFPNVNKEAYSFSETVNVKGNGNILARYQFEIQQGFHDVVLVFCDADKGSEQFLSIVHAIGERFFMHPDDAIQAFVFANPVTLQLVLSHFGDVLLTNVSKKKNAEAVKALTGVEDYDAKEDQIAAIMRKIHFRSLDAFKERLSRLSTDYHDVPSTNFLSFLEHLESDDTRWIDALNGLRR